MSHLNNGSCPKCFEITKTFPGFSLVLWNWFYNFQAKHPEFHLSEAGRGRERQEQMFRDKKSRAHWLESAHNFNLAIDTFVMLQSGESFDLYDKDWYFGVLKPELPEYLAWLGESIRFPELPHIEIKEWRKLVYQNKAVAVEPGPWRMP